MLNKINEPVHSDLPFNWQCQETWKQSSKNTLWCLIGCSIGDFGTILFFQITQFSLSVLFIMILAVCNGLITSIFLETLILLKQMIFKKALQTAMGMSLISMIVMEITMNMLDWILIGEAKIVIWIIPIMLISGFLSALPYNYWKLKKYKLSCH